VTSLRPCRVGCVALPFSTTASRVSLFLWAMTRGQRGKDWGGGIRGHGGVLDRLDSVVLSAPAFYHLLRHGWTS